MTDYKNWLDRLVGYFPPIFKGLLGILGCLTIIVIFLAILLIGLVLGVLTYVTFFIFSVFNSIGMIFMFLLGLLLPFKMDNGQYWTFSILVSLGFYSLYYFLNQNNYQSSEIIFGRYINTTPIKISVVLGVIFLCIMLIADFGFKADLLDTFAECYFN